ncbi:MAG: 4Fe-4S dicluster domain-containing protein [Thermincolia bacterium]
MSELSRRDFFKRSLASGAIGAVVLSGTAKMAEAATGSQMGTFIDLTKCDGCKGESLPKCVSACRTKNENRFPNPVEPIPNNWPTGKKEDWSKKRSMTDKLTPYNWTYVQPVKVEHGGKEWELFIQRRCMHCDNPPCANLCPFGVQNKTEKGPVVIDTNYCFGGAKCRDACPWNIPQRQAGVGIYMKIAPGVIGGGVMYKCDMCRDLVEKGQKPVCVDACPQKAINYGDKEEMRRLAQERAKEVGGFIYGDQENGGTSTFYVSPVPYAKINQAIKKVKEAAPKGEKTGIPGMAPEVENILETPNGMALGYVIAPLAGAFTAGLAAYKTMKGEE